MPPASARPTPAAAVVALRGDAVLLIRRGRPPNQGIWSFPGGSVEPGETVRETAVRETLEETGVTVELLDVADVVDVIVPATAEHPAFHYVITDFIATPIGEAAPRPGDDASEARWVPLAEIDQYALTPAMREVLERALRHLGVQTGDGGRGAGDGGRETKDGGRETAAPVSPSPSPVSGSRSPVQLTVRRLGEFPLIDRLARVIAASQGGREGLELGIGDDAAVLVPRRGTRIVATVDTLMEGIHFRRDWTTPEELGWKALAVNVSDIGAMGAEPWVALISLALPSDAPVEWVEGLYRGLAECAERYRCTIAGGDTVGSRSDIGITVAALGTAAPPGLRLRSGARPGDLVCVTGTLGDSAAGLALLEAGRRPQDAPQWETLFRAHLRPEPPVAVARALGASAAVKAMMDLSDGLASDLRHICTRSGVGARVRAADLPISREARAAATALGGDPLEWALRGGEDYQLLFTLQPEAADALPDLLAGTGVGATFVGEITETGYGLLHPDGREEALSPGAFDHFGAENTRP